MRKLNILLVLFLGNGLSETCVDTIVDRVSVMGFTPTDGYYVDSTFWFSEYDDIDISRKYYWSGDFLDSISENGTIYWKNYRSEDYLPANSNGNFLTGLFVDDTMMVTNFITRSFVNDTMIVYIDRQRKDVIFNSRIVEKHWPKGIEIRTSSRFDDSSFPDSSRIEILNDTAFITESRNDYFGAGYILQNSYGNCVKYDTSWVKIDEYTINYNLDGFEIQKLDLKDSSITQEFYRYFKNEDTSVKILNYDLFKTNELLKKYNLLGRRIRY